MLEDCMRESFYWNGFGCVAFVNRQPRSHMRYVAEFTKRVLSDTGHQAKIVQRKFDLDATDRGQALKLAKARFCELERIEDWSSRADEVVVREADFPS